MAKARNIYTPEKLFISVRNYKQCTNSYYHKRRQKYLKN